ncbi:MAG: M48 family metalloprotease, partial [Dysgonamonadaceae bacterium]|nr:M48 family metalloprotease [Dysgonamonadaceae bacterium]
MENNSYSPKFIYEEEAEQASYAYLMSVLIIIVGLPMPIINVIGSVIFWLANRKKRSDFIRFHSMQSMLSQLAVVPINSIGLGWTVSILTKHSEVTNAYIAYIIIVLTYNALEFFISLYAAVRVRKKEDVRFWFFGELTELMQQKGSFAGFKRTFFQSVYLVIPFLVIWMGLSRIDFVDIYKIKDVPSKMEKELGKYVMELISNENKEITDKETTYILNNIKERICTDNGINPQKITVHLVKNGEINAYALPDGHLTVNTELILYCKKPEELAGVMAHEIAHIEKKHVMSKLGKEIGFAALSAMLNSGAGGMEGLKILTSTAYDRKMEEQADKTGVEYLQKSRIDPKPFADLMYRLSTEESDIMKKLTIISTHPGSEDRAKRIINHAD